MGMKQLAVALLLCFSFLALPLSGAENPKSSLRDPASFLLDTSKEHHWFGFFELTGLVAFQAIGGYSLSPAISWKPTWTFNELFALRGNLGITAIKNNNLYNRIFVAPDLQLLGAFGIDKGVLEVGGGVQNWPNNGGINLLLSGNIGWPFREDWLGFIDRLVIGYSMYFSSPSLTHEIKFGLGAAF
jgi:hypothetical protein